MARMLMEEDTRFENDIFGGAFGEDSDLIDSIYNVRESMDRDLNCSEIVKEIEKDYRDFGSSVAAAIVENFFGNVW